MVVIGEGGLGKESVIIGERLSPLAATARFVTRADGNTGVGHLVCDLGVGG